MRSLVLALSMSVLAGTALAQSTAQSILTQQKCGAPGEIFAESFMYDEKPLFGGETLQYDRRGVDYWGTMFFTANQNTGFWTLYTFYGEELVCITASGVSFVPIVE